MVRKAFPGRRAEVLALAALMAAIGSWQTARAESEMQAGVAAVADAILWGHPMPAVERTTDLPLGVRDALSEYRRREREFHSGLTPPRGATVDERALFEKRLGIERTVFCLFPRRETPRVAASYALDADISLDGEGSATQLIREAASIDGLLSDLPFPWLAPYFNLIAGHRKVCGDRVPEGRRQLALAQGARQPVIRLVAEYLLQTSTAVRPCNPSP